MTDVDLLAERKALLALKSELLALRADIRFRRFMRALKAYNPHQPRVPAGNPEGGEWVGDNWRADRVRLAQFGGSVTDAAGRAYYRPGGHHEMPEAVYKKWNLQQETRQVFKQSSTGPIGLTFRTTPEGVRIGNIWDGPNGLHFSYNTAVEELSNKFMRDYRLKPDGSDMNPNHARSILKLIRESEDPRIRDFNANMRRIQRLWRLRGGADD